MNQEEQDVTVALKALSESLRPLAAPARVEQSLVREFRRLQRSRSRGAWWRMLAPSAALAAAVLAIVVLAPEPQPPMAQTRSVSEVATEYFPVGMAPFVAGEFTQVIRVSVSRSDVARLGVPMLLDAAAPVVEADVMVGEDGVARAIRFVH